MTGPDDLLIDQDLSWWLYRLPDGREVRVDVDRRPLRFRVDVQDGELAEGLTTDQVEELIARLAVASGAR